MRRKPRSQRVREKLRQRSGTRPRLTVFVSARHIYAQIIDDVKGRTLVAASDKDAKPSGKNIEVSGAVGQILGRRARQKKIGAVVFDRGGRRYHGKIRALAEAARKEGLAF